MTQAPVATVDPIIEDRRTRARAWFESLRDRIFTALETLEDEAPADLYPGEPGRFERRPWTRETGSGGGVGGFLHGRLFEKAGVHTSSANGRFSPEMAATMPGGDKDPNYVSSSISLIIHPRSPRVPAVHMNTRFLSTAESWFGGGADLTPVLDEQRSQDAPDAVLFHAALQRACDAHDPTWHAKYKAWCDEYFFLPHRNEPRGVGGIFYDRHNSGDFEKDFAFTRDVPSLPGHLSADCSRADGGSLDRRGPRGAAGAPWTVCGVQPALRPRNHVRPEDGGQHRDHPFVHAADGPLAVDRTPLSPSRAGRERAG